MFYTFLPSILQEKRGKIEVYAFFHTSVFIAHK